ncbi:MAG TPA: hypothetical protein VJL37_02650 [Flavobacterium sp.]|nr:hypothetical protein [Flavobacterium sp.]
MSIQSSEFTRNKLYTTSIENYRIDSRHGDTALRDNTKTEKVSSFKDTFSR